MNYEEEINTLKKWWKQKVDEHIEASDKARKLRKEKGAPLELDGDYELRVIINKDYAEFRRRLVELKEKYGMN